MRERGRAHSGIWGARHPTQDLTLDSPVLYPLWLSLHCGSLTFSIGGFCVLHSSDLLVDTCHCAIYVLGCYSFSLPLSLLVLCFGMNLNSLVIIWSFQVSLSWGIRWFCGCAQLGLILLHWGETFLNALASALWSRCFCSLWSRGTAAQYEHPKFFSSAKRKKKILLHDLFPSLRKCPDTLFSSWRRHCF